jgi:peptidoglycan/LPS O-acetylase OafA/YrhL
VTRSDGQVRADGYRARDALSGKLQAIRLLLMAFVVLIHTDPARIVLREDSESLDLRPKYSHVVLMAVRPGMTSGAVPMFFTISGFLFFCGFET